jgi:hypothetical protein
MKSFYTRESQLILRKNPGCKITKFNIGKLSGTAYQKALSAGKAGVEGLHRAKACNV